MNICDGCPKIQYILDVIQYHRPQLYAAVLQLGRELKKQELRLGLSQGLSHHAEDETKSVLKIKNEAVMQYTKN